MAIGAILIVLGVVVTIASDSESLTSLIPAFIGVLFVILGFVAARKPAAGHHAMHGAAALALLGVLGTIGSLVRGSEGWALFAQVTTLVLCVVFLVWAIGSFRAARATREPS